MPFHIAIDGPVAAGKGTVARLVAERMNLLYIDTGAMYRTTALLALRHHVDFGDEAKVVELLEHCTMEMHTPTAEEKDGRLITMVLDGEDVSWEIRTEAVSVGSSKVAVLPKVREHLVAKQQQIAAHQDVIMEGRDITYRVLPNANLKIYLNANAESRAKRRQLDLQRRGIDASFDTVYLELLERDKQDMSRAADPLQVVEGAWVLDTTDLSIDEVVDVIVKRASEARNKKS